MSARADAALGQAIGTADLVIPDGAGVVWALGRQQIRIVKTAGIELAWTLLEYAAAHQWRVALVGGERWNLRNARFRHDHTPLDPSCSCVACTGHTRAYLHHLIRSEELLGLTLLSIHNITHLVRFTSAMAQAIREGCFSEDFAPWEPDSPAHHTW